MNKYTSQLHKLGQRLWLDSIGRPFMRSGSLQQYISEFSITGLTPNPSDFQHAFNGNAYDASIRVLVDKGLMGEKLFFELVMEDLAQAADLLRPIFSASDGRDGWVSLELSPLLADDTAQTIQAASDMFERAAKANLFIKIPGTPAGVHALEALIFGGVPVNVSLLFSREHYFAAAEAYMRGIERRLKAGLDPNVASVASVFVSRWDVAVKEEISPSFHNRLGIAMAMRTYRAYRELIASARWQRLAAAGASPQRLLWASTGTNDSDKDNDKDSDTSVPDTLYVQALLAPDTIIMLTEKTLLEFADHGSIGAAMPADGGYADAVLEEFRREGVNDTALAQKLQQDGVASLVTAWHATLSLILEKSMPDSAIALT